MLNRDQISRLLGVTAVVAAGPVMTAAAAAPSAQVHEYHHGDVLGTALDLTVVAGTRTDADAAEAAVLAEVARLTGILSAYDPAAEMARLNASPVGGPGVVVSPELIDVLKRYDAWAGRTDGAYTGHAGDLIAAWKRAEATNQVPDAAALLAAAQRSAAPAWAIDAATHAVRRIADQQINVDSLGKGYVIDRAVAAATRSPNGLTGLLLNVGGDLRTWGSPSADPRGLWPVGVQDPAHPELNAKPLATIYVPGGRSVSTSGAYQRFYTVAGHRYSHILDARTGQPAKGLAATVVAADSATANAVATACCTLKFADAMALIRSVPGAEGMVVTADGVPLRTDGFKELQDAGLAAARFAPVLPSQFPAGYKLAIDLTTAQTQRRPYVFAWVTDAAGKHVKTLAAYGNDSQYWPDMRQWWRVAQDDRSLRSVTHATRPAGKYPLSWDGTDQRGRGVPLGTYKVWVEVSSEHGPYAAKFATIDLGRSPARATIGASSAFGAVTLAYGPGDR